MNLVEYQERVSRVCLDLVPAAEDLSALGSEDRWRIYRSMVRSRLRGVVQTAFPKWFLSMGDEFVPTFSRWLASSRPQTPLFRDVPLDFYAFVHPGLSGLSAELLRYEKNIWTLKSELDDNTAGIGEIDFEKPLSMTKALVLMTVQYRVHARGDIEMEPGKFHLLLYRDAEYRIVTLALNDLARDLVSAWTSPHTSLAEAVRGVAEKRKMPMGSRFLESLGGLLADYSERGIILGGAI